MLDSLLLLGTGPSSCLPNVTCLMLGKCKVCCSSVIPEFSKNKRGNISSLLKIKNRNGDFKHILIDCGKTFYSSTLTHFPTHKIPCIDAVILTHGHADAILGLDDLRPWCDMVESSEIPIYLDQNTFNVVLESFPYLVDTRKATGGGAVPKLKFNIIKHNEPFFIEDMEIIPLPVEHGKKGDGSPYLSLGYRIGELSYVSDTSKIPDSTRALIEGSELLILDLLREKSYTSHFGYEQVIEEVGLLKPKLCLTVGMNHELDHYDLIERFKKLKNEESMIQPAYDGLLIKFPLDLNEINKIYSKL